MHRFSLDEYRYPHRTYCEALEEMRQIIKHTGIWNYKKNKCILNSLIEECQTYGNRMEAALSYSQDLKKLHKKRKELNEEVSKLEEMLPEKEDNE